jgi:proteic killer suppression protein
VINSFGDRATEDIWNGDNTAAARRVPRQLWNVAARKLDMINASVNLDALKVPPGNRLEKLSGLLKEHYSIRINDQYRIVFRWGSSGMADEVRITDYH